MQLWKSTGKRDQERSLILHHNLSHVSQENRLSEPQWRAEFGMRWGLCCCNSFPYCFPRLQPPCCSPCWDLFLGIGGDGAGSLVSAFLRTDPAAFCICCQCLKEQTLRASMGSWKLCSTVWNALLYLVWGARVSPPKQVLLGLHLAKMLSDLWGSCLKWAVRKGLDSKESSQEVKVTDSSRLSGGSSSSLQLRNAGTTCWLVRELFGITRSYKILCFLLYSCLQH